MEEFIKTLNTLDELSQWATYWGMEDSDLVKSRRVEILSDLACSSVLTQEQLQPQK